MVSDQTPIFSVSDFVASLNQTIEYAYPIVEIEGEVANFKINQGKWVFFDLKDETTSVGCFMSLYNLRVQVEDGMKVLVRASPKVTQWGKFSLTIQSIRPSGEGSIKKSFELLKAKLEKEGLFAAERKRTLPEIPNYVGVISSVQAAGYADFVKIIDERWGGLRVDVAHTQVQGASAADQIIRAIKYFNEKEVLPEVLVIIRGGGSADDLNVFNDELLVREIASSRIPTLVGVGHEIDKTLADLVADVRAATPSNAAQILVPDRRELVASLRHLVGRILLRMEQFVTDIDDESKQLLRHGLSMLNARADILFNQVVTQRQVLVAYDPRAVLKRGYAMIRGQAIPGKCITIERQQDTIIAEVKDVSRK